MKQKNERSFSSVLTALFTAEPVPIHLLYRLSDMSESEFHEFDREWPNVNPERREVIVRHLADISEENYIVDFGPVFAYMLDDEAAGVRAAALDGVWDSTDTRLIEPIVMLMQRDESGLVRAAAARALAHFVLLGEWGQIDRSQTRPIVEALLAEHERPAASLDVKRATLEALAAADDPRVADAIISAYDDGPFELQLSAIFAMGGSADQRWLPIIQEELSSPSPDMRAEAAQAAGAIGSADMIDSLETLLDDEELEVAIAAVYALGQIGGDRAFGLLSDLSESSENDELVDAVDDALEEMEWLGGEFDMFAFADDEDDDQLDELRLN